MKAASIIIPTFNRAHLVVRAIESAINQTYPCEVIVCDHGSTDSTPDVVARYRGKIRYIRREEDNGPIVCWRDGIEQATGEIIHINYDDDWTMPTFMEKTIAKLDDDTGFVYTSVIIHYHDKNEASIVYEKHPNIGRMEDIAKFLIENPLTISPGCAIFRRKDALKNLLLQIPNAQGIYGKDSGVGEDLLLFLLTSLDYPKYAHVSERVDWGDSGANVRKFSSSSSCDRILHAMWPHKSPGASFAEEAAVQSHDTLWCDRAAVRGNIS